jgi:hypothetical protein
MICKNDSFQNDFICYNIGEKDVPTSPLTTGENYRSLTRSVLELFERQWHALCFETGNGCILENCALEIETKQE